MTKLVRFDWAIKHLLRNKANFDILEGFLSELLYTSIRIEEVLESEGNKHHAEDKFNRVDLLVKTGNSEYIIIEVQCSAQSDYLSRVLYGTSKLICEHIKEGDAYTKVRKVISISIVFFDLGEGKDYLYKGSTTFCGLHYNDTLSLNAQEKAVYAEKASLKIETPDKIFPEYYIIKVTRFKKKVRSTLDEWVYFLKYGEIKKDFVAKGLQSAAHKLDVLQLSEAERKAYEKYQESLHDEASFNLMLEVEGKKQRAEGRVEERVEIARSMKQAGLPDEEIARYTHLTLDEISNV